MIIDTIRSIQLETRKARSGSKTDDMIISVTTTLIGEAETLAKNAGVAKLPDSDVQALIKKFIKNLDVTIGHTEGAARDAAVLEKTFLIQFVPTQMTEAELTTIVQNQVAAMRTAGLTVSMGAVMSYLKTEHAGLYDAKIASNVIKGAI